MSDMSHLNSLYDKLFASVDALFRTDEAIKANMMEISSLVDFLSQNEAEIEKYRNATLDLQKRLDEYDFTKGSIHEYVQKIRKKVETLHPLRLKLVEMGEEAKKLSVFPDRYNSKKAIEICRNLVLGCREKMNLDESSKVMQVVETNTQKLIELRRLFERDDKILCQIRAAINADKMVLERFKAYYAELQQYVSEFPHSSQDDLTVVTKRIIVAKNLMAMYTKVEKEIMSIKDYCDRYNKEMVIANYNKTVQTMFSSMIESDVGRIETQLNDVLKQLQAMRNSFYLEHQELDALLVSLMSRHSDIWKEDNEGLLATVSSLLDIDTPKEDFDINQLKCSFSDAKTKRLNTVNDMISKYPWLESKKRYKTVHDKVISRYMESAEYYAAIVKLRRDWFWRRFCMFIPVIGWIILLNMEEVTV